MADQILPLFPLNIVAFPGEKLNLHIFEPRYRQLIRECEELGTTFIICPHLKGENLPIGTEMKLTKIAKKYKNGKMDIRTEGIGLVKIHAFYKTIIGKLYPGAEYSYLSWDDDSDFAKNKQLLKLLKELYTLMNVDNIVLKSPIKFRTYQVAHKVGFSFQQELDFLHLGQEKERQDYMLDHLQKVLPVMKEMEEMRIKAKMNGHFQNLIPPKF